MPKILPRGVRAYLLALAAVAVAGAGFWIGTRPEQDPFKASAIVDPPFPSLTYGIQTFLWWNEPQRGLHLHLVRLMSFSHAKQTFAWSDLEPQKGQWIWEQSDRIVESIEERGLQLVARLGKVPDWARAESADPDAHDSPPADLGNWSNFCSAVAQRYRGRISAYQIWNEPNLGREWGNTRPDAAAYVKLLGACSRAIRQADSNAILISAGLSPTGTNDERATPDDVFLDHMYRNDFQQFIDVVGVHAPGFAPPEIGPDDQEAKARWFTFRRVEDLRKIMLRYNDDARQMAIMEFGYTTDTLNPDYAWFGVTEQQQADYLERAYEYAIANWRPWIGLMTLIYMPDLTWLPQDEEYWWSILDPASGAPREAYIKLANMRKVCGEHIIARRPADGPVALGEEIAPVCP